jgi:hypothetical protein
VRADNIQASVAKFRLPSFVVSELTRGVNPLYDFDPQDRWPLAINLQTAGTTNNAMALRGGLQWRGFNSRSRAPQGRNRQERNRQDYDPGYDTDEDNTSTRDTYPDDEARDTGRTSGSRRPQDILGTSSDAKLRLMVRESKAPRQLTVVGFAFALTLG